MRKRILASLLVFVMMCSMLAACGSKAEEPKKEETTKSKEFPDVKAPDLASIELEKVMPEKELKFAFLCFQNNPFWQLVRSGADIGIEYLKNFGVTVDYIVVGDVLDAETINAGIDSAIVQGYDGIVVTPFAPGTEVYIDKAVDAGIPVITLYGESPVASKRSTFLGQDAYAAGTVAGEYIAKEADSAGKFAVITGQFTVENHEQRKAGCVDYLKEQGWEMVGEFEAMDKADLTYNYAKDILTSNPDVKAIYITAGGPFGAATAATEMKNDKVIIIGHDEVPENLEYIEKGEMVAISQDAAGVAVNGLILLYNKVVADKDPAEDFYPSNSVVITKDNVKDFQ